MGILEPDYRREVNRVDLATFLIDSRRISLESFLGDECKQPSTEMSLISEEQRVMRNMIPLGELEPLKSKPRSHKDRAARLEEDVADLMRTLFVERYHAKAKPE